jgi:hypothetical protein
MCVKNDYLLRWIFVRRSINEDLYGAQEFLILAVIFKYKH